MDVGVQMPRVGAPMIDVVAGQAKGFEQPLKLQEDLVFAAAKDIRQDRPGTVINRMPQPPRLFLLADKTPHFVHLSFARALNVHNNVIWGEGAQYSGVHRLKCSLFLPEFIEHRVRTDMQHPCRIAYATGIETHIHDLLLHLRQTPAVAIIQQKTPLCTRAILAQVALRSTTCFATFDNLLAATVGTLDRDERHGLLLAVGRYQDEVQCDIIRSPSPLLEHYRLPDSNHAKNSAKASSLLDTSINSLKTLGIFMRPTAY